MKSKLIILPCTLTLERVKTDTLKYIQCENITRTELSYRVGCHKTNITKFLNTSLGMQTKYFINLLNLLYHERSKEN